MLRETKGAFEWRPATMKHKILETIYEEPAKDIVIDVSIFHAH